METSTKKQKHMKLEDRIEIQECLSKGMTFKAVDHRIGKDPTTVSREVKLHALTHKDGFTKTGQSCPRLLKAPFVCSGWIPTVHDFPHPLRPAAREDLGDTALIAAVRRAGCKRNPAVSGQAKVTFCTAVRAAGILP